MTAEEALKELGETWEEVVKKLESLGVVGHQASFAECPLANYLSEKLGFRCGVGMSTVYEKDGYRLLGVLPEACREVRHWIDLGRLPQLIAKR